MIPQPCQQLPAKACMSMYRRRCTLVDTLNNTSHISHILKSQKRTSPYPLLLESILDIHCFDSSAVVTLMVFCLSFFLFEIEPGHTSVRNW